MLVRCVFCDEEFYLDETPDIGNLSDPVIHLLTKHIEELDIPDDKLKIAKKLSKLLQLDDEIYDTLKNILKDLANREDDIPDVTFMELCEAVSDWLDLNESILRVVVSLARDLELDKYLYSEGGKIAHHS